MVVDDQHLVRMGLCRMLDGMDGLRVVSEAESGEQALLRLDQLALKEGLPDVVLMDLRMPGIGGIEATRRLLRRHPGVKVVALTGCDERPFPQRFLECGASGFVTKDADIDEVVQAIRLARRGKRYLERQLAQDMALGSVGARDIGSTESPFECLSDRELQIALMVIDGIKTNDIARRLAVSPKSVNTYRYRTFEKLNINSNMELAMLAARHGLLDVNVQKN